MIDSARPLCDSPGPVPATPRAMLPAKARPTSKCWPASRARPTPRATPVSPAGQAGLPAEGDDADGPEFPVTLRSGGGLDLGGP